MDNKGWTIVYGPFNHSSIGPLAVSRTAEGAEKWLLRNGWKRCEDEGNTDLFVKYIGEMYWARLVFGITIIGEKDEQ